MLLLLPPSEGKAAADSLPGTGPLDLRALSLPTLTGSREAMQAALLDASRREDATEHLGVPATLGDLVAANLDIPTSRVGPAGLVYTGVLFDAAGLAGLVTDPGGPGSRLGDVLIASALYGMVGPRDLVAPYRMSAAARLPALGSRTPAAFWREPLREALDARADGDVVVDARSGAYAVAWTPPAGADHLTVRVEREVGGVRSVVSHSAKHLRGVLTGHLVRRDAPAPGGAEHVLDAARELLGTQVGTSRTPLTLVAADLVPAARRGPDALVLVTR